MDLLRLHAYEVMPQRLADESTPPRGGAFSAPAEFKQSLLDFYRKSKLDQQPSIEFRSSPSTDGSSRRQNDVRDNLLSYCFEHAATAKRAAVALATRLGEAMDDRSTFTLLLLCAYRENRRRRLVMWALPKDEPFHFSVNGDRARVRVLKDAFSRTSSIRKAALYEGEKTASAFWRGRVIDTAHKHGIASAADYWVSTFLDSRSALTGAAGTRLLATCLRATYDATTDKDQRDQLADAIVGVRASNRSRWTIRSFANEYLEGELKASFMEEAPSEVRTTPFTLQKSELDKKLNFRVFRLEDDVRVSAPFGSVGQSVKISGVRQRTLSCKGKIIEEKVRARHA